MVVEGKNAIKVVRTLVGATNPAEATPGTIRGDFGLDVGRNLVHASDSKKSAERIFGYSKEELRPYVEPKVREFLSSHDYTEIQRDPYLLKEFYYLLLTAKDFRITLKESWRGEFIKYIVNLKDNDGGFGGRFIKVSALRFEFTLYSVLALNELGYGYKDHKTVEYINSQRGGALWWSLPITRYSILALNSMEADIDRVDEIVAAIEVRKCSYGFFSYPPCDNPEIGNPISTFLALEILRLLNYF